MDISWEIIFFAVFMLLNLLQTLLLTIFILKVRKSKRDCDNTGIVSNNLSNGPDFNDSGKCENRLTQKVNYAENNYEVQDNYEIMKDLNETCEQNQSIYEEVKKIEVQQTEVELDENSETYERVNENPPAAVYDSLNFIGQGTKLDRTYISLSQ